MAEQITYTVNVDTTKATQEVNEFNESLEDLNETAEDTTGIKEKFEELPGPIKNVKEGVKGLSKGFKALLANPIVLLIAAIVGGLVLLGKAFISTKEGGEKMKQIMAGLGAVMDVLRDLAVTLGKRLAKTFKDPKKALMDFANFLKQNIINRFEGLIQLLPQLGKAIGLLFKGQFVEAGKTAVDALAKVSLGVENITDKANEAIKKIGEVTREAIDEAKLAAGAERSLQRVTDAERALTIARAEQNKIIAEAKLLSQDETKTLEERAAAVQKAGDLEIQLAKRELAVAKQRAAAIQLKNSLSDSSAEALDEEAAALARISELETESLGKREEIAGRIKGLRDQAAAESTAQAAEVEAQEKAKAEADRLALENKQKAEEQAINDSADLRKLEAVQTIEDAKALALALEAIELDRTNNLIAVREAAGKRTLDLQLKNAQVLANRRQATIDKAKVEAEKQKAIDDAVAANKVATTMGALSAVENLVGQDSKWGKSIAVTSAIIDTLKGANKALGQGGIFGIVGAAGVLATGFANVRTILSTEEPAPPLAGGGGGAATAPAGLGPSAGIIGGQIDSSAQLTSTLNDAIKNPPKSYVVGGDVTSQQNLDRHIEQNATVGE